MPPNLARLLQSISTSSILKLTTKYYLCHLITRLSKYQVKDIVACFEKIYVTTGCMVVILFFQEV